MDKQLAKLEQQFGLLRSKAIYYWKPFNRRKLMRFYSQFIKQDSLCFDVGAHLGNRLDAWLSLGSRVVALDPQPICYNYLQRHFGQKDEVTILPHAVSKSPGNMKMFISDLYPTVSTLADVEWRDALNDASNATVNWNKEIDVQVTTLDQLIDKYGMPQFCKIDVEGFEANVLEGLSHQIPTLSFEFLSSIPENRIKCVDLMNDLGNYEYNWSVGESQKMVFSNWVDAKALLGSVDKHSSKPFSGDIYAKLK